MLKYLRYALATLCFAASVGCLALWSRGSSHSDMFFGPGFGLPRSVSYFANAHGFGQVGLMPETQLSCAAWSHIALPQSDEDRERDNTTLQQFGSFQFSTKYECVTFPHWYPALISVLAGVGVIRFRRQFSIRSALIAFAVVAALLAMPLTL